jgi:hypothetical protein
MSDSLITESGRSSLGKADSQPQTRSDKEDGTVYICCFMPVTTVPFIEKTIESFGDFSGTS